MKKQILLITVLFLSIHINAQDEQGILARTQEQLYGLGQAGWEKAQKLGTWIKEHPKEAAALGLGAVAVGAAGVYGWRRGLRRKAEVPEWVKEMREDKQKLQKKLTVRNRFYFPPTSFLHFSMITQPETVIKLLYNFKKTDWDLDDTINSALLLKGSQNKAFKNLFKSVQIDDYSAFSAVIVSHNKSLEYKKELIEKLLKMGVVPTEKDCQLSKLDQWERRPREQKELEFITHGVEVKKIKTKPIFPTEMLKEIGSHLEEEPLIPREYCDIYKK